MLKNKTDFFRGETNLKEVQHEYNRKVIEREKHLKTMEKKIDENNKLSHVHRTRKQNVFELEQNANRLRFIDNKAAAAKNDRQEYFESRKVMMNALNQDIERFKSGKITFEEIEKKYAYLHDDNEFRAIVQATKKHVHAGRIS